MITRLINKALTISAVGMILIALGASPALALEEAPLVEGLKDLRDLDHKLVQMAGPGSAATVSLVSSGRMGAGSGVIVSEDGLILTCAHVVDALSEDVIVIFPDGSRVPAKPLGADFDRDAAMVRIMEKGSYPHVKIGKSKDLRRNDWCVALGHPGGFDPMRTPPVRLGRILDNGQFVRTDCAVVGGDSGGPLFNVAGEVIGIHSNIGATLSENRHVPIDVYLEGWKDLESGKRSGRRFAGEGQRIDPDRAVLGVQLGEPGKDGGVSVDGVMERSPAQKVGLKQGDLITKINDKAVKDREELIEEVGKFKAGDELTIRYLRAGKKESVKVELARLGDLMGTRPEGGEGPPQRRRPRNNPAQPKEDGKADEAEPEKKEDAAGAGKKADEGALAKLLAQALKEGELRLTPEELEDLGGMAELQKLVEKMAEGMSREELAELMRLRLAGGGPDRFFESSMKALTPVTKRATASTVSVRVDGVHVALGTVVSGEGWILTKSTETQNGEVTARFGEKERPLKLVKRLPRRDLALFEVEGKVEPVRWAQAGKSYPLGSLLTCSDPEGRPMGIGLVSVLPRAMDEIGFLGVQAGEADGGVLVVRTTKAGPAGKAGLRKDDVILSIDGTKTESPNEFGRHIRTYKAGDEVEVAYRRGKEKKTLRVKLGARVQRTTTQLSGPLSGRLTGFPEALQHDIPLRPEECGGPLLDLDGKCVGINVSRAGRVKTLAIPASDVRKILSEARKERSKGPGRTEARAAVVKELAGVEMELKAVEKKLKALQGAPTREPAGRR